jgi:formate-dependent nitrite reductase membrane component NrfD
MRAIEIFAFMQLLDIMTTLIGFRLGASEASPFIRSFLNYGPLPALLLAKAIAFGIGGACIILRRAHIIDYINYWFAALTTWNLAVILRILT